MLQSFNILIDLSYKNQGPVHRKSLVADELRIFQAISENYENDKKIYFFIQIKTKISVVARTKPTKQLMSFIFLDCS